MTKLKTPRLDSNGKITTFEYIPTGMVMTGSGPVFCFLLGVGSGSARPITGQVTSVTWPWSKLACAWLSIVWIHSEQEAENGSWCSPIMMIRAGTHNHTINVFEQHFHTFGHLIHVYIYCSPCIFSAYVIIKIIHWNSGVVRKEI